MIARDLARITRAAELAPFRYWIRFSPGRYAVAFNASPREAFDAASFVLKRNPYSGDMMLVRMQASLMLGDARTAAESFEAIRRLSPQSGFIRKICGGNPECPIEFKATQQ